MLEISSSPFVSRLEQWERARVEGGPLLAHWTRSPGVDFEAEDEDEPGAPRLRDRHDPTREGGNNDAASNLGDAQMRVLEEALEVCNSSYIPHYALEVSIAEFATYFRRWSYATTTCGCTGSFSGWGESVGCESKRTFTACLLNMRVV